MISEYSTQKCPICGHNVTDVVLTSNPPQYRTRCLNCGWENDKNDHSPKITTMKIVTEKANDKGVVEEIEYLKSQIQHAEDILRDIRKSVVMQYTGELADGQLLHNKYYNIVYRYNKLTNNLVEIYDDGCSTSDVASVIHDIEQLLKYYRPEFAIDMIKQKYNV